MFLRKFCFILLEAAGRPAVREVTIGGYLLTAGGLGKVGAKSFLRSWLSFCTQIVHMNEWRSLSVFVCVVHPGKRPIVLCGQKTAFFQSRRLQGPITVSCFEMGKFLTSLQSQQEVFLYHACQLSSTKLANPANAHSAASLDGRSMRFRRFLWRSVCASCCSPAWGY